MKADLTQSAIESGRTAYDEVPYPSYPFAQTHPSRLATIATLFGMQPANIERCRVLELGCASGGNLVPMADVLLGSTFVGIDASQRQIAEGQATIDALKLTNIELRCQNILDVTEELGTFDYIICHGVYSWVPEAVQDKILSICKQHLAPQGVAYVSYNTYPGWNMRGTIRDMMCYHGAKFDDPRERVRQAKEFLNFVARSVPTEDNAYGMLLKQEVELLRRQSEAYLLHDHLEENNSPVYFFEFASAADAKGLQYLGEAEISTMFAASMGTQIAKTVRELADNTIDIEQYLDFLRNRMFRQTILCHADIPLIRNLRSSTLNGMHVRAYIKEIRTQSDTVIKGEHSIPPEIEFHSRSGAKLRTVNPLLIAALRTLGDLSGRSITIDELFELCCNQSSHQEIEIIDASRVAMDLQSFQDVLLRLFMSGIAELSIVPTWAHGLTAVDSSDISRVPEARPLARYQAERNRNCTTYDHEVVEITDLDRAIIRSANGIRNSEQLVRFIAEAVVEGRLVIRQCGKSITDEYTAVQIANQIVPERLRRLYAMNIMRGGLQSQTQPAAECFWRPEFGSPGRHGGRSLDRSLSL